MQMHLPNQMGQQQFQPQFPMPVMGHVGGPMGQFGNAGASGSAPGSSSYNALSGLGGLASVASGAQLPAGGPIGAAFAQQQHQQPPQQQQSQPGQQNKGKQASELIHRFPDATSTTSSTGVEHNQGGLIIR